MQSIQRITPFLWFDDQAEEATEFYAAIFPNSKIVNMSRYPEAGQEIHRKPVGTVMTVAFELDGQRFTALNGGPHFTFTPSLSLFVTCASEEEVDDLWEKLSEGGSVLMPLQKYPFSERYGWTQDRYGLSWQVMLAGDREVERKIAPTLLFVGDQAGKAEEAMRFYTSAFDDAGIEEVFRYGPGEEPDREGTVKYAAFTLDGEKFQAMDSNLDHAFTFNEAVSLQVNCETQEEVDHYWQKLSEGGEEGAQQCGWLKDRYGVSWQIVPTVLPEMLTDPDRGRSGRAFEAMLQMKKLDIAGLKGAYG